MRKSAKKIQNHHKTCRKLRIRSIWTRRMCTAQKLPETSFDDNEHFSNELEPETF
jgi:hypothetical protein